MFNVRSILGLHRPYVDVHIQLTLYSLRHVFVCEFSVFLHSDKFGQRTPVHRGESDCAAELPARVNWSGRLCRKIREYCGTAYDIRQSGAETSALFTASGVADGRRKPKASRSFCFYF